MSLEAISIICDAEQYAQSVRVDTQTQVRKIKADGEREGRERLERALNGALTENKRQMKEAEQEAGQRTERIIERSNLDCTTLKEQANGRLDEAVRLILERIVVA